MNYTNYKLAYNNTNRQSDYNIKDTGIPIEPYSYRPDTETECHYVFVNSIYRDITNYPLHYDYRINLRDGYNDVVSVEMVSVIIPNSVDILNEPVLLFDIEELNFIKAQNAVGTNIFSIIPLKGPNKTVGGFINPELACNHRAIWCNEIKPISRLNSLTVKIKGLEGNLFDFGDANGSIDKALQHSFVLKIKTKIPVRERTYLRNH